MRTAAMPRTSRAKGDLAPLRWDQADEAGRLLARAFHNYPALTFLVPDERRTEFVQPHVWTAACRYTIRHGEAWVAPGVTGVACWLPAWAHCSSACGHAS